MRDEGGVIQGLWIGRPLSLIERLSMASFLRHGHEYHLYCYEDFANVPAGVVIRDANEILPASGIFSYQKGPGRGSVAAFSNLFRYKLLLERGGWWCDMDVVCLRPFDFPEPVLFAAEHAPEGLKVNNAVMKLPPEHPAAAFCCEAAAKADPSTLHWGATGPDLLSRAVIDCRLLHLVAKPQVFFPIPYWEWRAVLADDPGPARSFLTDHTHAIHLWHEEWRRAGADRAPALQSTSLLAQLLEQFDVRA